MKRPIGIAGAIVLALALAWFGFAPAGQGLKHSAVVGSPQDHGIAFETIELQPADAPITLRAWWMPAAEAKAAIIMVHGGGNNRSQRTIGWLPLARSLIDRHYSVLALDLRNHGESGDTVNGSTFGVTEAADVTAAIDYLAKRAPGTRFAAIGYSMGGETAIYAASRDRRLEAIVADSAYADARDIVPYYAHAASGLPAWLFSAPFIWSAEHLHGVAMGARAVDVIGEISPRSVFLIHDAADPIVTIEHCKRLAAAYPAATVWITSTPANQLPESAAPPWGTHAKSYLLQPEEYVQRVTRFFDGVFDQPPQQATASR
jgi:pimeloyl-ACP methyl ester carboxylesterase